MTQDDRSCQKFLEGNARFVDATRAKEPDFFAKSAKGQAPTALWIGCSDSRVSPNQATESQPGELFVHRNIANLVVHTDLNLLSVLQYAVEVLKVPHVIVCGHYGCGGVAAAMGNKSFGLIDEWIRNVKDVYRLYQTELASLDQNAAFRRLVELNVLEQVTNVCETSIIQRAWANGAGPQVHGWVYDLEDGRIRDLGVRFSAADKLQPLYRYSFS